MVEIITQAPAQLIAAGSLARPQIYVDVNPRFSEGQPILLTGVAAVFASIRNLYLCPRGSRDRIFGPEYFSGLYHLLQEPFDEVTNNDVTTAAYQALVKHEPRVTAYISDFRAVRNPALPGVALHITITVNGQQATEVIDVRLPT